MKALTIAIVLSLSQSVADNLGCYVTYTNPNHCFEVPDDQTELPNDLLTLTPLQILAKYGVFVGSFINRSWQASNWCEADLSSAKAQIKKLKRLCGAKCRSAK